MCSGGTKASTSCPISGFLYWGEHMLEREALTLPDKGEFHWAGLIMPVICLMLLASIGVCFLLGISPQTPLGGVVAEQAEFPVCSRDDILSGKYQSGLETWINQNFPFRSWLIKCYSQFMYSVMKESVNDTILVGKDGYLFGTDYVTTLHYSLNEGERERYREYAENLKTIQDELEKRGKSFFYILSPNKAEAYSSELPYAYRLNGDSTAGNRHEVITEYFNQYGIHYYDTTETIQKIQREGSYEPFTKNGSHWTGYAAARSISDMLDAFEAQTGNSYLPPQIEASTGSSPSEEDGDVELAQLLNLFWTAPEQYTQLQLHYNIPPNYIAPKVYVVGTSFSGQIGLRMGSADYGVLTNYRALFYLMGEDRWVAGAGKIPFTLDGSTVPVVRMAETLEYYDTIFWETGAGGVADPHFQLAAWMADYLSHDGNKLVVTLSEEEAKKIAIRLSYISPEKQHEIELKAEPGQKLLLPVVLENGSNCTLKVTDNTLFPFCVVCSVHSQTADEVSQEWALLTDDLEPGETDSLLLEITAPETPGDYVIQITAAQLEVVWLDTVNEEFMLSIPLTVEG